MEYIECILCNSKKYFNTIETVTDRFDKSSQYQIQRCRCGMISTNPRLDFEELSDHYKNKNYHPQNRENRIFNCFYRIAQIFNNRSKKKLIQKYHCKGFLLDYGGGDGQFCRYMSRNNWNTHIYEPYLKISGIKGGFVSDKKEVKSGFYDVISMFHSLEHIYDLDDAFSLISRSLIEKGVLIVSVPNYNAAERPWFKSKWIAYDVPRHVHHFTIESIKKILDKYGFEIIDYRPMYIDTIYNIIMSYNSRLEVILKAPLLILIMLAKIFIYKSKASSIMLACQKK